MSFLSEIFIKDRTGEDWRLDKDDKQAVDAQILTAVRLMQDVLMDQLEMTSAEAAIKLRWATHVLEHRE